MTETVIDQLYTFADRQTIVTVNKLIRLHAGPD